MRHLENVKIFSPEAPRERVSLGCAVRGSRRACRTNAKSFPNHNFTKPYKAALISVYTRLVHRAVCLFTSQLSLIGYSWHHGRMARLSWHGCTMVTHAPKHHITLLRRQTKHRINRKDLQTKFLQRETLAPIT